MAALVGPSRVFTQQASRKWVKTRFHFGFTLIELLVVIAIIAILAAILFPVFASAKTAAQKARCVSQLKQLAIAVQLYTDDNNSHYVPAAPDIFDDLGGLKRWHGVRKDATSDFEPQKGPLWTYMAKSGGLKQCPLARGLKTLAQNQGAFESGGGGFGYNYIYVGGTYYHNAFDYAAKEASSTSDIRSPGRTVMFTDSAMALPYPTPHAIEYSFCEPPFRVFNGNLTTSHNSPSIHFRQGDTASVAWCDGHVSCEKMSFTTSKNIYGANNRQMNIGWFGPDDNSLFDNK